MCILSYRVRGKSVETGTFYYPLKERTCILTRGSCCYGEHMLCKILYHLRVVKTERSISVRSVCRSRETINPLRSVFSSIVL